MACPAFLACPAFPKLRLSRSFCLITGSRGVLLVVQGFKACLRQVPAVAALRRAAAALGGPRPRDLPLHLHQTYTPCHMGGHRGCPSSLSVIRCCAAESQRLRAPTTLPHHHPPLPQIAMIRRSKQQVEMLLQQVSAAAGWAQSNLAVYQQQDAALKAQAAAKKGELEAFRKAALQAALGA